MTEESKDGYSRLVAWLNYQGFNIWLLWMIADVFLLRGVVNSEMCADTKLYTGLFIYIMVTVHTLLWDRSKSGR